MIDRRIFLRAAAAGLFLPAWLEIPRGRPMGASMYEKAMFESLFDWKVREPGKVVSFVMTVFTKKANLIAKPQWEKPWQNQKSTILATS